MISALLENIRVFMLSEVQSYTPPLRQALQAKLDITQLRQWRAAASREQRWDARF